MNSRPDPNGSILPRLAPHFTGWRLYARALRLARPELRGLAVGALLSLGLLSVPVLPPLMGKILIDTVIPRRDPSLFNWFILAAAAVLLVELVLGCSHEFLFASLRERLLVALRTRFARRIGRLPVAFLDRFRAGELAYRLMSDTGAVPHAVTRMAVDFAVCLLSFFVIGAVLCYLHWQTALLCLILVPLYLAVLLAVYRPMRRWALNLRREQEAASGDAVEFIRGTRLIRCLGVLPREESRLAARFDRIRRWAVRSTLIARGGCYARLWEQLARV